MNAPKYFARLCSYKFHRELKDFLKFQDPPQ